MYILNTRSAHCWLRQQTNTHQSLACRTHEHTQPHSELLSAPYCFKLQQNNSLFKKQIVTTATGNALCFQNKGLYTLPEYSFIFYTIETPSDRKTGYGSTFLPGKQEQMHLLGITSNSALRFVFVLLNLCKIRIKWDLSVQGLVSCFFLNAKLKRSFWFWKS